MIEPLDATWKATLNDEIKKTYYLDLQKYLAKERLAGALVFPPEKDIFHAFHLTPFDAVKVVILGQDPYHGENQANGLAFSVRKGLKIPPSLRNIFKELAFEYPDFKLPEHGDLSSWAKQGVLLLNTTLTVAKGMPASHQGLGWEEFTDTVIQKLSSERENLVFLLWGKLAIKKSALIDPNKHVIFTAPHPSPFSAHTGFLGCNHFVKTNEYLKAHNKSPIHWDLFTEERC